MIGKLTVLCAVAVLFNILTASAQNAPVTDCDRLAASPEDPQRKASGVSLDRIVMNAVRACESAVRQYQNDARLIFQLGRAYDSRKKYQAAIRHYRKSAENGYAVAQNNLAFMYDFGHGVAEDGATAFAWYRRAAEQGLALAQSNLGGMYERGRGVAKDDTQAAVWYRKAAEQGVAIAQSALGTMYENGQGVAKDRKQALSWYRKVVVREDVEFSRWAFAKRKVTELEWKIAEPDANAKRHAVSEAEEEKRRALAEHIKQRAEEGDASAQSKLGVLYEKGLGVSQDYTQAFVWFRKAADQGDAVAQHYLGWMYREGRGVSQDYIQAVAWVRKAAEQGNANAQEELGSMYELGRGVTKDYSEALAWYRRAAEQRRKYAKRKVSELEAIELAEKYKLEAKRDPDDVVAQVLNYSSVGNDEGIEASYWYQDKSDRCRYKRFGYDPLDPGGAGVLIDLNVLDPKNITFEHREWSRCVSHCETRILRPSVARDRVSPPMPPVYRSGVDTIIQHDADVLFQTGTQLNLERLQRGWSLIYSQYCKGDRKSFFGFNWWSVKKSSSLNWTAHRKW